jgi:hypothetical protein
MPIKVDQCKHYNGLNCSKCGRMLPDVCVDQEELEGKAAAFDKWVAEQQEEAKVVHLEDLPEPPEENTYDEPAKLADTRPDASAPTVAPKASVPLPAPRRGKK